MAPPVLLLAPLSRDEIVAGGRVSMRVGGAGFYAAGALAELGARVILHTPLAGRDGDLLDALPRGVEVIVHPSRETTRFRIEIDARRPDERRLVSLAACDPLDPDRIGSFAGIRHVLMGPLLPGDVTEELLGRVVSSGRRTHIGVQGLTRRVAPDGEVSVAPPGEALRLPRVEILAGDEAEIGVLDAVRRESASEVVTTSGDRGALIHLRGAAEPIRIPAVAPRGPVREPVGLGDVFLAVYGWWRVAGLSPEDAGARAARAATMHLEGGGPTA